MQPGGGGPCSLRCHAHASPESPVSAVCLSKGKHSIVDPESERGFAEPQCRGVVPGLQGTTATQRALPDSGGAVAAGSTVTAQRA